MNIDRLKADYWAPVPISNVNRGRCVGGIYLDARMPDGRTRWQQFKDWFAGRERQPRFPGSAQIANAFCLDNPNLHIQQACVIASALVNANDSGNYSRAWWLLDLGLHWTPEMGGVSELVDAKS